MTIKVKTSASIQVTQCPRDGCKPPPPPTTTTTRGYQGWSDPKTWEGIVDAEANPFNVFSYVTNKLDGTTTVSPVKVQNWTKPMNLSDVWIPSYKKVILDASTPPLGHLIIEGALALNSTGIDEVITLTATYIEIRGGSLTIAQVLFIPEIFLFFCNCIGFWVLGS